MELLRNRGVLMGYDKLEHSYPHCWRCHNPVIFRATEQWFITMEAKLGRQKRCDRGAEEIDKVNWYPGWGEGRISK